MESEDSGELVHRSPEEVARRCIALLAIVERAHGERLFVWPHQFDVSPLFSPRESAFYNSKEPSQQEIIEFAWRAETLVPLLWALNVFPSLPALNERVDLASLPEIQNAAADPATFISTARLRDESDIDEAEAGLFEQHWRVRDAQLFRNPCPPELDPDVVYERRYALSWLVGWGDGWDEVPTDT